MHLASRNNWPTLGAVAGGVQEEAGGCPWWNWVAVLATLAAYGFTSPGR
jgi:hypothetical protein